MPSACICTKHGKEQILAPILSQLNITVFETTQFDTDTLGTFSGERPRMLSPQAAAREKARQALALTDADYGLGSEGSFACSGMLPGIVNEEVLCLIVRATKQEVYATLAAPTTLRNEREVLSLALLNELEAWPKQSWHLFADDDAKKSLTLSQLRQLIRQPKSLHKYTISPDFRADRCPERREVIGLCAQDLVRRLRALCPQCEAPDFVERSHKHGLPCASCGTATTQLVHVIELCNVCQYQQLIPAQREYANPFYCNLCNP